MPEDSNTEPHWGRARLHASLPAPMVRALRAARAAARRFPPLRALRLASRRPTSRIFGYDRGTPIDRAYIESFLAAHRSDVKGRVLEVGDDAYTVRFGEGRVDSSDVFHRTNENPRATLVGDLSHAASLPVSRFDCIILTQTLQMIHDAPAALRTVAAALRPGGVLLASFPGISQVSRYDMDRWGDSWRFTSRSIERLLGDAFPGAKVTVEARGNVLASVAFLQGLAAEELSASELAQEDPDYQLVILARVVTSEAP